MEFSEAVGQTAVVFVGLAIIAVFVWLAVSTKAARVIAGIATGVFGLAVVVLVLVSIWSQVG